MDKIAQWLTYQPRTRLVFVKTRPQNIQFFDFGYEFAKSIQSRLESPMLPMIAEESARNLIKAHTNTNGLIGKYVALENWDILFEPELKIDLRIFLTSISQNKTIFLLSDTSVKNAQYHNLNLSDLEYYEPEYTASAL